jgi:hypothetical protein
MTFFQWCKTQKKRDDAIGDLARDILQDRDHPRGNDYTRWQNHLYDREACGGAIETLERAFECYRERT